MWMRGGTSKGAYFLRDDLPDDRTERDRLLLAVMGSPDPRQIDGIGGGHPLTSKVAVVGTDREGHGDVEYLFLQVAVDEAVVSDRQYCGNILAGVGPFSIERGLVDAEGDKASVSIHMLNHDSYARAEFPMSGGMPAYSGGTSISGVPGTAASVTLEFEDIAGSASGDLLPTGRVRDQVDGLDVTMIDNGMPVVVIRADDLEISGYETCAQLEANRLLRDRLETIRQRAAGPMNLGDVSKATVPKLTLVAAARDGGSLSTRTFIPHRCHDAIGVLGAVSVATAALLPGSVASDLASPTSGGRVVLEHPTGTFEAFVDLELSEGTAPAVIKAGIVRTARKLMDGLVFPRL